MNLLAQADQLKSLSDQQLAMERGRVPEYLLVAELQRRDQMRKAYQADLAQKQGANKSTVSDELWQQVLQPQPQQQLMMPMGGGAPPQQAMSAGGLIQRLAAGGMVRYAEGGKTDAPRVARTLEDLAAMRGPTPDLAALRQQAEQAYGPDALSPIMAEMAAQKASAVANKPSIWQALMQMGVGMMASRNPTPLGGLGEGLSMGLGRYMQDRDMYRQDQIRMQEAAMRNLNARAGLAEAQNRRQAGIAGLANDAAQRASAQGNVNAQLLQQSGLASMNDEHQSAMQKAQQDFMAPYYQSQITENNAQAERYRQQAAQQDALWQSYLKRAGGDPAKAKALMDNEEAIARARAAAMFREVNPMNALMQKVIQEGISRKESPEEILARIQKMKSREEITDERINQRATIIWRQFLEKDISAMNNPQRQQELWQQALEMAAVGIKKPSGDTPPAPAANKAKSGIKILSVK